MKKRKTTGRPQKQIAAFAMGLFIAVGGGCAASEPPPLYERATLTGSAYERGYAHGELYAAKIRSLYTQLLTAALLPNLNREHPDIAPILLPYQDEKYADGRFSYEVMLESAEALEASMPEEYLEEIRGIADGARLPFRKILVLNTFVDSVLGVRTIQRYLSQYNAPFIQSVAVIPVEAPEEDASLLQDPYEPLTHAHWVDVPTSSSIRIVLVDGPGVMGSAPLGDSLGPAPEDPNHIGIDPKSIRIVVDDELFVEGDDGLSLEPLDDLGVHMAVTISPPGGLAPASAVAIGIEAGNLVEVHDPPPTRSRIMRQQWITLATEGLDVTAEDIPNAGRADDRFPPTPISFAAEGAATPDGARRLAHHFSLLDAGTLHRHVVVFTHEPDDGIPHVVVGWTGLVGGFSGMNAEGLVWSVNHTDTLDNPVVASVGRTLMLLSDGLPIPMVGRKVLSEAADVETAAEILVDTQATAGWNHLLAGPGGLRLVEKDGGFAGEGRGMDHVYGSERVDDRGRRLAAVTDHDLRSSSHYLSNTDDSDGSLMGMYELPPQRFWSPFWNRSLRVFETLGERLADKIGEMDAGTMIEILRDEALVDPRDSMNAVVYEPESLRLWLAAGEVPATDAPFELIEMIQEETR